MGRDDRPMYRIIVCYGIERVLLSSLGIHAYPITLWMTPFSLEYGAKVEAQH